MRVPVPIAGMGSVRFSGDDGEDGGRAAISLRLSAALEALAATGRRIRLIHELEEAAFVAAVDAFTLAGGSVPLDRGRTGIALGVDEGIDGVKASHRLAVSREGPTGASPLHFPLTAPNAVAAQLSIALDLRGESVTYCGGALGGARALGHALHAVREGRAAAMLAGGATSIGERFLEGLVHAGYPYEGSPICAAGMILLQPSAAPQGAAPGDAPALLGFGDGFGEHGARDALLACLEDAGVVPGDIGVVRIVAGGDEALVSDAARRAGIAARPARSSHGDAFSADFPLALADALRRLPGRVSSPVLVAGTDCWGGAAAVVAR